MKEENKLQDWEIFLKERAEQDEWQKKFEHRVKVIFWLFVIILVLFFIFIVDVLTQ